MSLLLGLAYAGAAAVAYGVQYVPVKNNEIFDGTTFQWFMGNGILAVGFLAGLFSGELHHAGDSLVITGGVYWGLSNYLVLPCVKLLGLGLGFSLYHFVNLIVAYCVGRFGFFGIPPMTGKLAICDVGCILILISFFMIVGIEDSGQDPTPTKDAEKQASEKKYGTKTSAPETPKRQGEKGADRLHEHREMYRHWRENKASGEGSKRRSRSFTNRMSGLLTDMSVGEKSSHMLSPGGFSLHMSPQVMYTLPDRIGGGERSGSASSADESTPLARRESSAPPLQRTRLLSVSSLSESAKPRSRLTVKLAGTLLAVGAGFLCGIQSVPAALHNQKFPTDPVISVVFPQCIGIWLASTLIYLIYSTFADFQGWPVHHSVIRPAFCSGTIWAAGFVFMMLGIRRLGYSVCYTIDAVGPIAIAGLLSVCVFGEIQGARKLALFFSGLSLQAVGVVLIAVFGTAA